MANTMTFEETRLSPFYRWLETTSDRIWAGADEETVSTIPFRQLIDELPQCIFWKDVHGRFIGCNSVGAKRLGLQQAEQIEGKTDGDLHQDPELAHYLQVEDCKVIQGGVPVYRVISRDGQDDSARWYETSKIPLRDTEGLIIGLLICYEDVTERVRSEEAQRQHCERLDVAANFMHNWSMWIDRNGRLRWVSPAVEAVAGYSAEECYAMPDYPLPIVHPEDQGHTAAIFDIGMHDRTETQFRFVRKDGKHRWGAVAKRVIPDKDGQPNGVYSSVIDITTQKEAEEILIELNKSLELRILAATEEAATKERLLLQQSRYAGMGEMIGHIAHQWRQPLTALGLLLQNVEYDARDNLIDTAELTEKLQQAFHLVAVMSSTIDDFRNFFHPVSMDISFGVLECVEGVLRLLDASLSHAEIAVTVDAPEACQVLGRPNEMAQVLLNLLSNAKDALVFYRPDHRQIHINIAIEDDMAVIRERNNGDFISEEDIDRIFDPYYTTKEEGTGLGLYMCKQIIEEHFGGEIGVANTEDGVEFVLKVPLARQNN